MPIAFAGTSVMIATGFATGNEWLIRPSVLGALGFFTSYLLVRRGAVRAAAFGFVVTAIALVTNSAVSGAGLRDPAVLAYPVIILFAGMTLKLRSFLVALAAVAVSVMLVEFNHVYAWIPTAGNSSAPAIDLIIVVVILGATAYAVWLLATSANASLSTAHSEIQRRRSIEAELQDLSSRDSLTGVFNRRYFDTEMSRLEPARHYPVSIIVADVDRLKAVNDELGHAVGDQLLLQAAATLATVVRVEDVLARIGGDEFAILLPDTDAASAQEAVDRIEKRLEDQSPEPAGVRVSLSLGTATSVTGDLAHALVLADSRMYVRKLAKRETGATPVPKS
jgi:diguanylate cyclase (GGDEF)-like protein